MGQPVTAVAIQEFEVIVPIQSRARMVACLVVLYCAFSRCLMASPPELKVEPDGTLVIAGIRGELVHFGADWQYSRQRGQNIAPEADGGGRLLRGTFTTHGGTFALRQSLRTTEPGALTYEATLTSPDPIPTNCVALALSLPADLYAGEQLLADNKAITLPRTLGAAMVFAGDVRELRLPVNGGMLRLDGARRVFLQDDRAYGGHVFTLRLLADPDKGEIRETGLRAMFTVEAGKGLDYQS
jgi:hypothetical protein